MWQLISRERERERQRKRERKREREEEEEGEKEREREDQKTIYFASEKKNRDFVFVQSRGNSDGNSEVSGRKTLRVATRVKKMTNGFFNKKNVCKKSFKGGKKRDGKCRR